MKKIFTKSLAAMAATTILIPAVFAETGTGSISEENMTFSSASSTKSTTPMIMVDSAEIWKMVHCQIMKNGFEWVVPTSLFANKNTCNGIGTSFSDQNKLNAQRQLVLDYIKSKNEKNQNSEKNNSNATSAIIKSKSAESYKNFIIELTNFEKNFTTLNENNIENYIKGVAEIFAKTYGLEFPNEYRQRHFMGILQKYYAIPNISREKLETMATKYNFPVLADWVNKTKNMSENDIAWIDFGMVHNEYKITAEEKIDSLFYISLYNYQGKILDKSNLDINATIAPITNGNIKIEKQSGNGQDFNIIGENVSPNLITTATISISQKNNSTLPITTTFPIKFTKIIDTEEKMIFPTDEFVLLPNGFEWKLEKDLIKDTTKVKIIAKTNGDFINYRVVYSNDPSKEVVPEGKTSSITVAYPKAGQDGDFARNFNEIERYNILKYFSF